MFVLQVGNTNVVFMFSYNCQVNKIKVLLEYIRFRKQELEVGKEWEKKNGRKKSSKTKIASKNVQNYINVGMAIKYGF